MNGDRLREERQLSHEGTYRRPRWWRMTVAALSVLILVPQSGAMDNLSESANVKSSSQNEVYLRYFHERYSYIQGEADGIAASFVYRNFSKLSLSAEAIFQRKFGFDEAYLGLAAAYRLNDDTSFLQTIGFAHPNKTFPKFLTDTEVVHRISRRVAFHLGYKLSDFEETAVRALYAGSTIFPRDDLYFHLKIFEVTTDFPNPLPNDTTTSALFKVGGYPNDMNEVAFVYARNAYSFTSVTDVGNIKSNTYGLLWKHDVSKHWGTVFAISYEARAEPFSGNQVRLDIGLRFAL